MRLPSGDHVASVPATLPSSRSDVSRTLVRSPISTSSWPSPGRKPRGRPAPMMSASPPRSEEHTSELQSHSDLVCRLLLEKKKKIKKKKANKKQRKNEAKPRRMYDHITTTHKNQLQ